MARKIVGSFFFLILVSCVSGPCRTMHKADSQNEANKVAKLETVKVYKYDGTLQCGMGSRTNIEDIKKELKDISVISSTSRNDGLMRIQLCGSPTGDAHVFEIHKTDLEKAQALGFKPWTFE